MSWVLLTPDRAYKLKKPVHFGFLDLREPAARRRACRQEVEVNQALAARIVLGVRGVVPVEGGLELAPEGAPDAIDWVVEMVRFDEERTMAAAVRRDALRDEDVVATARTIQRFHADAGRPAGAQVVAAGRGCLAGQHRRARGRRRRGGDAGAHRRLAALRLGRSCIAAVPNWTSGREPGGWWTGTATCARSTSCSTARASWSSIASSSTRDCGASTSPTTSRSSSWICAGSGPAGPPRTS